MGLNDTVSAQRIHIGFFGLRNAGKSSIVNAVTNQEIALVSDVKGTTTDPVYKAMELLPLGPVMIVDTPGFDDEGELGQKRVQRTRQVLNKTDIAVLVVDSTRGVTAVDRELLTLFKEKDIPAVIVCNKSDIAKCPDAPEGAVHASAVTGQGIHEIKTRIAELSLPGEEKRIVGDLLRPGDLVVLVTPIDESAPKGRIILPQQQTLRDVLDADAFCVVAKETELKGALDSLGKKPALVITDSQVFGAVSGVVPGDIPLTSFSILMARYKGFLDTAVEGAAAIKNLKDGDTVLISEGCTHHRQCNDIGTVKLPGWLRGFTGKDLNFEFSSGTGFPEELSKYALVIHCGGCMLPEREVLWRMKCARYAGVPFTNYGIAIALFHGVLGRSIEIFPHLRSLIAE